MAELQKLERRLRSVIKNLNIIYASFNECIKSSEPQAVYQAEKY